MCGLQPLLLNGVEAPSRGNKTRLAVKSSERILEEAPNPVAFVSQAVNP